MSTSSIVVRPEELDDDKPKAITVRPEELDQDSVAQGLAVQAGAPTAPKPQDNVFSNPAAKATAPKPDALDSFGKPATADTFATQQPKPEPTPKATPFYQYEPVPKVNADMENVGTDYIPSQQVPEFKKQYDRAMEERLHRDDGHVTLGSVVSPENVKRAYEQASVSGIAPAGDIVREQVAKAPRDESNVVLNTITDLGVVSGDAIQNLTTPKNAGILAAMALIPRSGPGTLVRTLVDAGFSVDMAKSAGEELAAGIHAYQSGDLEEAKRHLSGAGTSALFSLMSSQGIREHAAGERAEMAHRLQSEARGEAPNLVDRSKISATPLGLDQEQAPPLAGSEDRGRMTRAGVLVGSPQAKTIVADDAALKAAGQAPTVTVRPEELDPPDANVRGLAKQVGEKDGPTAVILPDEKVPKLGRYAKIAEVDGQRVVYDSRKISEEALKAKFQAGEQADVLHPEQGKNYQKAAPVEQAETPQEAPGEAVPNKGESEPTTAPLASGEPVLPQEPAKESVPESSGGGLNYSPQELADFVAKHGVKDTPQMVGEPITVRPEEVEPVTSGSIPAPGQVGAAKVADLELAPKMFQYKLGTDEAGTTNRLKDTHWDPKLAGTISVWTDPKTGANYVVNGHHRFDLAKRSGAENINVFHIEADTPERARAIGALQNIAEGRGTAIDAAKFMRDSKLSAQDLASEGVSLGEKTAAKGIALSKLDDSLFDQVVQGKLSERIGVAIGESTDDPAIQRAIAERVAKEEARGRRMEADAVREMVDFAKGAGTKTESMESLFGTLEDTRSLLAEKAEVSAAIKRDIESDRKIFGAVASEKKAEVLSKGKNVINAEENARISKEAAQALELYDKFKNTAGPVSDILNQAAKELADGRSKAQVVSEASGRIREELRRTLSGGQEGSPQELQANAAAGPRQERPAVEPPAEHRESPVDRPATQRNFTEYLHTGEAATDVRDGRAEFVPAPKEGLLSYVRVNDAAHSLISELGHDGERSWNAVNWGERFTPAKVAELRQIAEGIGGENGARILGIADALQKALDANGGKGLAIISDRVPDSKVEAFLRHESAHGAQRILDQTGDISEHTDVEFAASHELHGKIADELGARGYDKSDTGLVVGEAAAHFLEGDHLGLDADGVASWAQHYLESLERKHGEAIHGESHPLVKNLVGGVKSLARIEGEHGTDTGTAEDVRRSDQGLRSPEGEVPRRGEASGQSGIQSGAAGEDKGAGPDSGTSQRRAAREDQGADKPRFKRDEEREVKPTFYSQAEKIAQQKLPESILSSAVEPTLRNNGVKPEELKWLGLDDFLKNKGKVSKQEVLDFIRQNNVQVKEVTKGAEGDGFDTRPGLHAENEALQARADVARSGAFGPDREGEKWNHIDRANARNWAITVAAGDERLAREAKAKIDRLQISDERKTALLEYGRLQQEAHRLSNELLRAQRSGGRTTKYHAYQLPGGENYRELLLTLPEQNQHPAIAAYEDFKKKMQQKYLNEGQWAQKISGEEEGTRKRLADAAADARRGSTDFHSGHFDEPNVLAHIRFNDRYTSADGTSYTPPQRVLFLEEVQSDWHQKGRKQGYKNMRDAVAREYPTVKLTDEQVARLEKSGGVGLSDVLQEHGINVMDDPPDFVEKSHNIIMATSLGVPDAPFKKTWHELALKRMLRYAAENGYDKLAWTPGEVQNDRYDLSKHLQSVIYQKQPNGEYLLKGFSHDGVTAIDKMVHAEKLEDFVGKELAQKIIDGAGEDTTMQGEAASKLSGLDLKVGGSGMKGFYDKIIPDFLNKYGKKWGAKVGESKVQTEPPANNVWVGTTTQGEHFVEQAGKQVAGPFKDKAQADAAAEDLRNNARNATIPAIDITPEMKESVLHEGQPLFHKPGYGEGMDDDELQSFVRGAGSKIRVDKAGSQASLFGGEEAQYKLSNGKDSVLVPESRLARVLPEEEFKDLHAKLGQQPLFARGNQRQRRLSFGLQEAISNDKRSGAYDKIIDSLLEKTEMGKPNPQVRRFDPEAADLKTQLDASGQFHKAVATKIAENVVGNLKEEPKSKGLLDLQEANRITRGRLKGFHFLADKENREWVAENRNSDYQRWSNDPKIEAAVKAYKPYEEQLREAVKKLGGKTIDEDYIKRVMDFVTGGIDQPEAKTKAAGVGGRDSTVSPQVDRSKSRKDNGEFYWNHGVFDFGPSFEKRWVEVMSKLDEHQLAVHAMGKGVRLDSGDQLPASIHYNGQVFYRPDVAREIREVARNGKSAESKMLAQSLGVEELVSPKEVHEYGIYEPFKGGRFESAATNLAKGVIGESEAAKGQAANLLKMRGAKYAVPKEIADTLNNVEPQQGRMSQVVGRILAPVTQLIRQQIVGFGYGVPHIGNVLRKVMQQMPGGAVNPKAWIEAGRVAFSKELHERGIDGVNDPAYKELLRNAGISEGAIPEYKHYVEANLNPATWANAFREGGKAGNPVTAKSALAGLPRLAFEPLNRFSEAGHSNLFKTGGIDQRARLWLYDRLKSSDPGMKDADIAHAVNQAFGRYNRASWTDVQRGLAPFLMFPGWDMSSVTYAMQHPIKTSLPPAVLILLSNYALNSAGLNDDKDKNDPFRVHVGHYAVKSNLISDNMGSHLTEFAYRAARAKMEGKRNSEVANEAARGAAHGLAGLTVNTLNPILSGVAEVGYNRKFGGSSREIDTHKKKPYQAVKDYGAFVAGKAVPSYEKAQDDKSLKDTARDVAPSLAGISITNTKHKRHGR